MGCRSAPVRRREILRLVHDEQTSEWPVARRVLLDPGEQSHLELIDEALLLLVCGQPREVDHRYPGFLTLGRRQQDGRVDRRARSREHRIVRGGGLEILGQSGGDTHRIAHLARVLGEFFQQVDEVRQIPAPRTATELIEGRLQHCPTMFGLLRRAEDTRGRFERGQGGLDRGLELVRVAHDTGEVG